MRKHPQLYLPETKEIHFFDWYFYKSLNWYCKHFKDAKVIQIKGEVTPGYSIISEKKIRFIKKINSNLKIILLLRNPIERAWSHAIMNLSTIPKREINTISDEEFIAHFNHPRSKERGDYPKIISKWKKNFPNEQFFIRSYNDIKENPEKLLNEVFNFLEVNEITNWDEYPVKKKVLPISRKSEKKEIPLNLKNYLKKLYRNDIEKLIS